MSLKDFTKIILIACVFAYSISAPALSEDYVTKLDKIRNSIIQQGNILSTLIPKAKGNDIRTLERVYELNTSTLTTIEAYLKMLKVVLSSRKEIAKDDLGRLDGWLLFIHKQCKFDIEYLDEALSDTKEEAVIGQIKTSRQNMEKLANITAVGIEENKVLLGL